MAKRIANQWTTWNLVNIKARQEQTTSHYVEVFRRLYAEDPLIKFPRGGKSGSLKSVQLSELLEEDGNPCWIHIGLLSYTVIDPEAFYNKRSQEDVKMENWDENIVANKKEADLYFIPSIHTLAVKSSAEIGLKNVVYYLAEALNKIEPEIFDVDVIVEKDVLNKILTAHLITHLYANISYSNPGHTHGFEAAFDSKLRGMGGGRFEFTATGSKEHPLNNEEDGMLPAIVNLSEQNGYVRATIQSTANSKLEKIDSSEHPRRLVLPRIVDDICSTLYNAIKGIIH